MNLKRGRLCDRRNFLTALTAGATLATTMPKALGAARKSRPKGFLWADLLHFGKNMAEIVKMGDAVIRGGRLKGFLTTTWQPTVPSQRKVLFSAVDQMGELI